MSAHRCATIVILLAAAVIQAAEPGNFPAPPDAVRATAANVSDVERVEHLQEAINHLLEAGELKLAESLQAKLDDQRKSIANLLEAKRRQILALQAEVRRLETALQTGPVIQLECVILEAGNWDGAPISLYEQSGSDLARKIIQGGAGQVLSRPQVVTRLNSEALVQIGQSVPILRKDDVGNAGIEFRDVGVSIRLLPTNVKEDGTIELEAATEISQIGSENAQEVDGIQIPAIHTRKSEHTVAFPAGKTICIATTQEGDKTTLLLISGKLHAEK